MRTALRQFLAELEHIYTEVQKQTGSRRATFQLPTEAVDSHEELVQILYEITMQLENPQYYQSRDWENAAGYAHMAVDQRFRNIFAGRLNHIYRQAMTGVDGGLRAVVDEFVNHHLNQTLENELRGKINEFYEIEYGSGSMRNYEKMWEDHEAYFKQYSDLLPYDVQARASDFTHGSSINKNRTHFPFEPLMHELYMMHPTLTVRA